MKELLERHIADIFSSLHVENTHFEVYECGIDVLPEWTDKIQLTHDFLICSELNLYTARLQQFLGKKIFQYRDKIYWFEGELHIQSDQAGMKIPVIEEEAIVYLKKETLLPKWLDNFIYNDLGAEYAPNFQKFEYNLDLTKEENLKYLGTYFPRSYAESFCIFDNIFQNKVYKNFILSKDIFNILSIGSGTGGDLIGLMTVIDKYCPVSIPINILTIDGNENALSILGKIVDRFKTVFSRKVTLTIQPYMFPSIANFDMSVNEIGLMKFDFILSFKMINEIISNGKGACDNSYYDFIIKFLQLLSNEGLCTLLDVTTKAEHTTFNPILMNWQINQALQNLNDYQTLLPLSCNNYEKICSEKCFTQQKFYISHSRKIKDISKVSYRVIGKMNMVNMLLNNRETTKYILQRNGQTITTFCPYSDSGNIVDGYKLNN